MERAESNRAIDRRILRLAVPALGALAVEPIYVLVDTAIVGRLGTDQLAGLAIAAAVLSLVVTGSNFLTYGTTERVARLLGAGNPIAAGNAGVQAVWLSVLVGTPLALVLGVGARPLAHLFGAGGATIDYAVTFLSVSAVGVPFILFTLAAQGVLRGESRYVSPLWILLASNVANVLLEVALVFGMGWGVAGSAWSTVICQVGAAFGFLALVLPRLRAAAIARPSRDGMAPLMSAGRHLLIRVAAMLAVFVGSTSIAARVDAPTLAAHQVVVSVFFFLALVLDALAVPAQTIVAEELGRGAGPEAALVARRSAILSVITGAVLAVVVLASSSLLPRLFSPDSAVQARATSALLWLALLLVPGAIAFAYDGVLIGAGDYRFLGRAAFAYLMCVIPFGVAVLLDHSLGIAGIWSGLVVWMILRAYINHRRTRSLLGSVTG